jgi:ATPase subunit of ABC transporter with duplicated ATPase domains
MWCFLASLPFCAINARHKYALNPHCASQFSSPQLALTYFGTLYNDFNFRLKKEKRRKEEESIRQEEEEIKRKKEEEEAKRIADAQAIMDEARARAEERKKQEAEEAEANPQPKEQKSFHEIWLVISYKSGCSGHRIVEYTDDNGKQWYEKQMLLSLNDRIAKKKSKVSS